MCYSSVSTVYGIRICCCFVYMISLSIKMLHFILASANKRRKLKQNDNGQSDFNKRSCNCNEIEAKLLQEYLQFDIDMELLLDKWKSADK